jgi:DNA-binding beta-propeller fold protein YncE
MSTAAHGLSRDLETWDGRALADGAKIVLQAVGRYNDGRLEDYGPAWVTLKRMRADEALPLETYLVADTKAQPHVFTVRTLAARPGEYLTSRGAPSAFQKLILLAGNGRYVDNEPGNPSTLAERDLSNAGILILDLTQQKQARLLKTPWSFKDRDLLPGRIDVYTLRFECSQSNATILEGVSFSPATKADLLNLKVVQPSLNLVREIDVAAANTVGMIMNQDGSQLYAHNNGALYVIDTMSNTAAAPLELGTNSTGVALSPDGAKAYVTHSMLQLSVIDTAASVEIRRIPLDQVSGVAVATDGKVYVTDSYFGNLWKLDKDGKVLGQMQVASTGIDNPLADPANPRRLFVMIEDEKSIAVVDTFSNTIITKICLSPALPDEGVGLGQMAISPDGNYLCVVQHPQYITLINTATYAVEQPIRLGSPIQRVTFSADGFSVFVSFPDLALSVRRDTREIVAQLTGLRGATQLVAHPNNQLLYIANRSAATISVVETM